MTNCSLTFCLKRNSNFSRSNHFSGCNLRIMRSIKANTMHDERREIPMGVEGLKLRTKQASVIKEEKQ